MKNAKLIQIWMIIICALLILGIGIFLWQSDFFVNKNVAIATTQNGAVTLIAGSQVTPITSQTKLLVGESIQTFDGESLITINENHFLWLQANSKVTLTMLDAKKIIVALDNGNVWYMHINTSDGQQFDLVNKLATITPRGTKFFTQYDDVNQTATTFVVDGIVTIHDDKTTITLSPFEKAHKSNSDALAKVDLDASDKNIAKYQLDRDYALIKSARDAEINKHNTVLGIVKDKFNFTDAQIQDTLAKLDSGELDEAQLLAQSPVPIPGIDRLKALNAAAKNTLQVNNALLTH